MTAGSLIRFDGLFTTAEQQLIHRIVAEIEKMSTLVPVPDVFGPPWLVLVESAPDGKRVFIANRLGEGRAVTGRTVEELVKALQAAFTGGGFPSNASGV